MIFLIVIFFDVSAQKIDISIFHSIKISSVIISPIDGKYDLICDSVKVTQMKKQNVILIDLINDSLHIRDLDGKLAVCKNMYLKGKSKSNYFRIKPVEPEVMPRDYDNDIKIFINEDRMMLINHVELENYISGVVKSEGGSRSHVEYYKSQAIIARTYTLEHLYKHKTESFNLCDHVHCQAYHGKCLNSDNIVKAT